MKFKIKDMIMGWPLIDERPDIRLRREKIERAIRDGEYDETIFDPLYYQTIRKSERKSLIKEKKYKHY